MQNNKPIWFNEDTYQTIKENKVTEINIGHQPKYSIMVCTPCHSEVSMHYTQAVLKFQQQCLMHNIMVSFTMLKSSLVTQGRNLCVSAFFEEKVKHDYLLFIDSDIDFEFGTIMKMLKADKDIIAYPYPLKDINWEKIQKKIEHRNVTDPKEYSRFGYTWPIKIENRDSFEVFDEVAEVTHAPTGCMLIKRSVFETMMEKLPHLKISQPTIVNGKTYDKPYFYNFFDTHHDQETKRYYGEDFGFCIRWNKLGGKCHILISDDFISHVGEYKYTGRLKDDLESIKNVDEDIKTK
jgi:hypothetical protein